MIYGNLENPGILTKWSIFEYRPEKTGLNMQRQRGKLIVETLGPELTRTCRKEFFGSKNAILTDIKGRLVQRGLAGLSKIRKIGLGNPRNLTKWPIFEYKGRKTCLNMWGTPQTPPVLSPV